MIRISGFAGFVPAEIVLERLGAWWLGLTASVLAGKTATGHPQVRGNAPKIETMIGCTSPPLPGRVQCQTAHPIL